MKKTAQVGSIFAQYVVPIFKILQKNGFNLEDEVYVEHNSVNDMFYCSQNVKEKRSQEAIDKYGF